MSSALLFALDVYLTLDVVSRSSVSGGYCARATPDPISNSVVKPRCANGTVRHAVWESRSPPGVVGPEGDPFRALFFSLASCPEPLRVRSLVAGLLLVNAFGKRPGGRDERNKRGIELRTGPWRRLRPTRRHPPHADFERPGSRTRHRLREAS